MVCKNLQKLKQKNPETFLYVKATMNFEVLSHECIVTYQFGQVIITSVHCQNIARSSSARAYISQKNSLKQSLKESAIKFSLTNKVVILCILEKPMCVEEHITSSLVTLLFSSALVFQSSNHLIHSLSTHLELQVEFLSSDYCN